MMPITKRGGISGATAHTSSSLTESRLVRRILTLGALLYLGLFLVVPVIAVFAKAFEGGVATYWAAIGDPVAFAAIRLTIITAAIAVPLNTLFGLAASWAIAKFEFPGKHVLITLIDLPFSVSPVISGMIFVLLFGAQGLFG